VRGVFVLLMMLAAAQRKYWVAGVLGLLSCLVRQDNVIWVAFAVLWSYLRDRGWTWEPPTRLLARYWTFIVTGVAFLLFVTTNHGQVALGADAGSHPVRSLYFTNIFFLLFLSCFLFLPLWWGYRRDILARTRSWWTWLSLLGLFPIFWLGFVNDHPHNTERGDFFLRNAILIYFSSTAIRKLFFFVPVAVAALCLAAVPMKRPWWLLYVFTILFLLPEWLVEQRYYLIPLSLFLLARDQTSPWSERLQTTLFFVGSVGLFLMVERKWGWM
jgi:alpha-1,2-glucosyltransferase